MPIINQSVLDVRRMLTDADFMISRIRRNVSHVASCFQSAEVVWNEQALLACVKHFQANCENYFSDLLDGHASHIKIFGYLLYSLTQLETNDGFIVSTGENRTASSERALSRLMSAGLLDLKIDPAQVHDAERAVEFVSFLEAYANEYLMFMAVYLEFCMMQISRPVKKRFVMTSAPVHHRYIRSMMDYLRPQTNKKLTYLKTPFDFYMIFKTMDLFGMDTNYLE